MERDIRLLCRLSKACERLQERLENSRGSWRDLTISCVRAMQMRWWAWAREQGMACVHDYDLIGRVARANFIRSIEGKTPTSIPVEKFCRWMMRNGKTKLLTAMLFCPYFKHDVLDRAEGDRVTL